MIFGELTNKAVSSGMLEALGLPATATDEQVLQAIITRVTQLKSDLQNVNMTTATLAEVNLSPCTSNVPRSFTLYVKTGSPRATVGWVVDISQLPAEYSLINSRIYVTNGVTQYTGSDVVGELDISYEHLPATLTVEVGILTPCGAIRLVADVKLIAQPLNDAVYYFRILDYGGSSQKITQDQWNSEMITKINRIDGLINSMVVELNKVKDQIKTISDATNTD